MYHHFTSKTELFQAVFEAVEDDLTNGVMVTATASGETDPMRILEAGFDAFLDQCRNPEVQRIVMLEGPTVLGWDTWHELDERYAFGTIKFRARHGSGVGSSRARGGRPACRTSCWGQSCRPAWSWPELTTRSRRRRPWSPPGASSSRRSERRSSSGVGIGEAVTHPFGEARGSPRPVDATMHRYRGGARLAGNAEQIGDLERRPGHGTDDERDVDLVVERRERCGTGPRPRGPGTHARLRPNRLAPRRKDGRSSGGTRPAPLRGRADRPRGVRHPWRRSRRNASANDGRTDSRPDHATAAATAARTSPPSPVQRLPGAVRRTTAVSSWPCDCTPS